MEYHSSSARSHESDYTFNENWNMETKRINIGQLTGNAGQIEGLPANPRTWTQTEIDRLAKSLQETPELFEMRPLLVYQQGEEYVILGSGSSASPIYLSRTAPEIAGIGIVCSGGANDNVKRELISLLSATFHISSNRIYITEGS